MIHATIDTFEEEVIKQKGLVLVDFLGAVVWTLPDDRSDPSGD